MTRICSLSGGPQSRGLLLLLLAFLAPPAAACAQGSAGSSSTLEPRVVLLKPSAGMLAKGTFALDVELYQEGGVLIGLSAGIFERLSLGVSYGGAKLLGTETPVMNPLPGVSLRVRPVEESESWPAIVLGFDSQGKNGYLDSLDRYLVKSPGLFAVLSKNYLLAGYFSIHGGVNYSFERADGDRDVNVYVGAEKTLGPFLSLAAEYDLALNDNSQSAIGRGRGYLNIALRASLGAGVTIGVSLMDLLQNQRGSNGPARGATLEFVLGL
jgi:hypothetical protein